MLINSEKRCESEKDCLVDSPFCFGGASEGAKALQRMIFQDHDHVLFKEF